MKGKPKIPFTLPAWGAGRPGRMVRGQRKPPGDLFPWCPQRKPPAGEGGVANGDTHVSLAVPRLQETALEVVRGTCEG